MTSLVYDLHSHTTASDGVLTPDELIKRARHRGVNVLAVTDHDTTSGLSDAQKSATSHGITLVHGIELSVTWQKNHVHIVGLNINASSDRLKTRLVAVQKIRQERAQEMSQRLEKVGINNALAGAREFSLNNNITRTHFARYIVSIGRARTMSEVFKRYLVPGKPGYVSVDWIPLDEAVELIQSVGGCAVVAHPARYKMTNTKMKKLLAVFADVGGAGIEVINSGSTREIIENNISLANQFGLAASIGSDFHSPDNKFVDLGRFPPLPDNVTPIWEGWDDNKVPDSS